MFVSDSGQCNPQVCCCTGYIGWLTVCSRNLITGLTSAPSPRVDISSTCKIGQKLGVSLPLLACSHSAWPSRLLYRRGRNSRRDLRIALYLPNYFLPLEYLIKILQAPLISSVCTEIPQSLQSFILWVQQHLDKVGIKFFLLFKAEAMSLNIAGRKNPCFQLK
jgi:hypothetical protein